MFILESITIFVFFALLFTVKLSPKYVLTFIAICGAVYFSEMSNNPLVVAGLVILLPAVIWTITCKINFDTLKKSLVTAIVCNMGMLLTQFWVPLYCLATNTSPTYIENHIYLFGVPGRIVEYVILLGIYVFKVKPELGSVAITGLAKNSASVASIWWLYQPKTPKSLKKD